MDCRQCGEPVEPTREQWSTPVCWACIRPTLQDALEEVERLRGVVPAIVADLRDPARCGNCRRLYATDALWNHKSGCECEGCKAHCWDVGGPCESVSVADYIAEKWGKT
jgi:hypothetical protein